MESRVGEAIPSNLEAYRDAGQQIPEAQGASDHHEIPDSGFAFPVCRGYLNGRSRRVIEAFQRRKPEDTIPCSVLKAELHYGAMRSKNPQDALAKLEEFQASLSIATV